MIIKDNYFFSLIEREDIERFLFDFDDILNYKSKNNTSTSNGDNDKVIQESSTESENDELTKIMHKIIDSILEMKCWKTVILIYKNVLIIL